MTAIAEAPSLPEHLLPAASAAFGRAQGDLPQIASLRAAAAASVTRLTAPTRADRPWRYTDFSALALADRHPSAPATTPPTAATTAPGPTEVIDGVITRLGTSSGATVGTPAEGVGGDAAASLVGTALRPDEDLPVALHYSFFETPLAVSVPDDVEVEMPLRITRRYTRSAALAAPHTLIVTGRNARLTIVEDYRSADTPMTVLPAVEIFPGPGAEVRYTMLHLWGPQTIVFANQRALTARDSALVSLSVMTGGATVKSHIISSLEGRGSSSEIFGLFAGQNTQRFDLFTVQDHIGPDTRSDLLYKSALKDEASSIYYGLTRVGLNARNADANQENRNLLLSRRAKADSDPVLEILTSDVIRAAHGATAGPVDQGQLFYLEARGIARPQAEELLVAGFLGEVLDRIPDAAVRDEAAASVGLRREQIL